MASVNFETAVCKEEFKEGASFHSYLLVLLYHKQLDSLSEEEAHFLHGLVAQREARAPN